MSGSFRQNEHTISHGPAIYPPSTQVTGIGTPALELAQDFDFSNEAMDMDIDDGLELKKADEDVVALPGGIKSKLPRKKERNLNSVSIWHILSVFDLIRSRIHQLFDGNNISAPCF